MPLDLVLFNRTQRAFGAHVGIFVGGDQILHLSKQVGVASVWRLNEFARLPRYSTIIGAKRTCK